MTHPVLSFRAPAPAGTLGVSLEQLMVGGLLLQAGSGGGKSRAIRQLLEETHGRVQHLVFDPEGEFASLRERFDYVHAAPSGADVVATPKTARLLCRRLVETGASAVLDIYDLKVHEKREFVRLALEELMVLPRALWKPILVVVDEADFFFPQQGESSALEAGLDVNGRGRKRGYRLVLTTRRLSKLHKDVADVQNRMIGYTGLDLDVKRAGDELGLDKEGRAQLTRLDPGTFFVYGPAIARTPALARSGAVTTTHPEPGKVGKAAPPAPARVRALIAQLADLPKEAEEEAKTLDDLRKENGELKRKLKTVERTGAERVVEKVVVDERAIARAVDAAVRPFRQRDERMRRQVEKVVGSVRAIGDSLEPIAVALGQDVAGAVLAGQVPIEQVLRERAVSAPAPRLAPRSSIERSGGGIAPGEQRILNALAELNAVGIERPTRTQAGIIASYDLTGGSGSKHVSALKERGLVTIPSAGTLALTEEGSLEAVHPEQLLTRDDLHQKVLSRLNEGERRILEYLIGIYPAAQSRADVGREVRYDLTGGSGSRHVSKLVTLGFIDIPGAGQLRAGKLLYPEGL